MAEVAVVAPGEASDHPVLRRAAARHRLITTSALVSFAQASNLGARATNAPYVLFLNDDTVVSSGAIERLALVLDTNPGVGIAAPKLVNPDGSLQGSIYDDPGLRDLFEVTMSHSMLARIPATRRRLRFPRLVFPERSASVNWASGAALMVRRDLLEDIGGLDERYPHGMEDAALCLEVRRRGRIVLTVPESVIVHALGTSGYRSPDPERLRTALVRGAMSWDHYFATYRRPSERMVVRLTYMVLAFSRVLALTSKAALSRDRADVVRGRAYAQGARDLYRVWVCRDREQ